MNMQTVAWHQEDTVQAVADTSRNIGEGGGGGRRIFNMYAFGVGLRYMRNLSNIMLGDSSID